MPSRRTHRSPKPGRPTLDIGGVDPLAAVPTPLQRGAFLSVLLRFITCGILALASGLAWRLTLAPARIGIGSALAGILVLLLGFIVGGLGWYLHDARLRQRAPEQVSDERLVFSFVVFAAVPFAVLLLVGLVWIIAILIGTT